MNPVELGLFLLPLAITGSAGYWLRSRPADARRRSRIAFLAMLLVFLVVGAYMSTGYDGYGWLVLAAAAVPFVAERLAREVAREPEAVEVRAEEAEEAAEEDEKDDAQ